MAETRRLTKESDTRQYRVAITPCFDRYEMVCYWRDKNGSPDWRTGKAMKAKKPAKAVQKANKWMDKWVGVDNDRAAALKALDEAIGQ